MRPPGPDAGRIEVLKHCPAAHRGTCACSTSSGGCAAAIAIKRTADASKRQPKVMKQAFVAGLI